MQGPPSKDSMLHQTARAKYIQQVFDEKILDLFLYECDILLKADISLKEFSKIHNLQYDMEEQYYSMKRVYEQANRLINISLAQEEGWKNIQMDKKCSFSVRSNNTIMEIKSSGIIDLPLIHALIVPFLIKHYTSCFPFCKEALDLKEPTRLEKVGFMRLSIPIPFLKDRSVVIRGIGFQLREKPHKALIYAEGVTQNKEYLSRIGLDLANLMKGRQLLDVKHFAIELTCLGANSFSYTAYALVDHHMPMLPERLVMFVAKELGKYLFNKVLKELKNWDKTVWAKEMKDNYQENAFFYDWISKKMESWLQEIAQTQ